MPALRAASNATSKTHFSVWISNIQTCHYLTVELAGFFHKAMMRWRSTHGIPTYCRVLQRLSLAARRLRPAAQRLRPSTQCLRPVAQPLRPVTQWLRPRPRGCAVRPNACAQFLNSCARFHKVCAHRRKVCASLTTHKETTPKHANHRTQSKISYRNPNYASPFDFAQDRPHPGYNATFQKSLMLSVAVRKIVLFIDHFRVP